MDTQTFIDNIASGNASEAKNILNDLLSNRAFEALDAKKVELAKTLFNGEVEGEPEIESEVEVQGTEEITTEE